VTTLRSGGTFDADTGYSSEDAHRSVLDWRQISLEDDLGLDGGVEADYNESEPFPMVGFCGSWLLNKNWLVRGTAEAFSIDMNDTEGDFYNVRVECEYALTASVSIGAGYDLVRIDAEDNKRNNRVNYDYDGALA